MRPKAPDSINYNPESNLYCKYRNLLKTALALSALCGSSACSDESSAPEPKAWGCVSILDQNDLPMTNCTFDYVLPLEGEDKLDCEEGEMLFYGSPGKHKINADCGTLAGYVQPYFLEGENETFRSRLVNSLCYNENYRIILDPDHDMADLSETQGRSTDTRCANWLTPAETRNFDITGLRLECPVGYSNCDPEDARDYVEVWGENGQYSGGKPIHLTLKKTSLYPPTGEVTIQATMRERTGAEQEIERPVIVRGTADGGAGGSGGSDAGNGG